MKESRDRNLKAGTEAEIMQEYCLLVCSSCKLSPLFYIIQDHQPRGGPAHSRRNPLSSIIDQENVPQTSLQANFMEAFSQLRYFLLT